MSGTDRQPGTMPPVPPKSAATLEDWLEMALLVARHYGLNFSRESVRLAMRWQTDSPVEAAVEVMARHMGLSVKFSALQVNCLTRWRLPLVVQLPEGQLGLIESLTAEGKLLVRWSGDLGLSTEVERQELLDQGARMAIFRPASNRSDVRIDGYIKPYEKNWFRDIVLSDLRPYRYVMFASLIANVLGLAGVMFSMQVYDRAIPANSLPTLYVLFVGVLLAAVFDFVVRCSRSHVTDLLGKRADIRVSDKVFGHAIRLRNSARPRSTGTFIAQLRELESIREMVTSSTVTALADFPFFLLFLLVFWLLVGPLVLVPLVALVFMLAPSVLSQGKLGRFARESMREASLRNALLVEAVQGSEDIKALQAETRFQQQWNQYNAATASSGLQLKALTHSLQTWSQVVQMLVFALVVVFGAPMVMSGDLTTGALVAASILGSRMMAPMAQLTQVIIRWQQAKVALQGLDNLMQQPVDGEGGSAVHRPYLKGDYELHEAVFAYGNDAAVLKVGALRIEAGERIAVLGRNGAGKSTLLQALTGGVDLSSGLLSLDGVSLAHLDPADVRRDAGLLTQNARLFHGTIRENLMLGAPQVSDEDIFNALNLTGAVAFIRKLPTGLDHMILEGGVGLSGGQRQSLLLARLVLRQPSIVLLDEPTASLDETTERLFLQALSDWSQGKTLIIATHRLAVLELVDRIIVVDEGQIILDEPKEVALAALSSPHQSGGEQGVDNQIIEQQTGDQYE